MKRLQLSKIAVIARLKEGTTRRIIDLFPMWKQHNALVRAHFLLSKRVSLLLVELGIDDPLTTADAATLDKVELRLRDVMKMASHSRKMEADINNDVVTDIDSGWQNL